ncbi:hypothetical protein HanXRQr2_Chr13g0582311 [Helianthus annuus]|uniref:Uncharacterized protein n=1 Tax=Helianthus annuus TaxID=4232 RepID=A0A9K3EGY6_HELAN|nr:hypothetical protein HanXRQr2_Chr13g0582311 [Helianthus annuus]
MYLYICVYMHVYMYVCIYTYICMIVCIYLLKAIGLGSKRCLEKFSLFFKLSYFLKVRTSSF